jgi:hypothetical protein
MRVVALKPAGAVRSMHDPAYGFPRTPLLRTRVNKGKKKGRGDYDTAR